MVDLLRSWSKLVEVAGISISFPLTRQVNYPISNEECSPVHFGNIISCTETASVPEVHYEAQPDQLFTLVMTSLDSHLESTEKEYLHWMV